MTTISLEQITTKINKEHNIDHIEDPLTKAKIYAIHTILYAIVAVWVQFFKNNNIDDVFASNQTDSIFIFIISLLNVDVSVTTEAAAKSAANSDASVTRSAAAYAANFEESLYIAASADADADAASAAASAHFATASAAKLADFEEYPYSADFALKSLIQAYLYMAVKS